MINNIHYDSDGRPYTGYWKTLTIQIKFFRNWHKLTQNPFYKKNLKKQITTNKNYRVFLMQFQKTMTYLFC